MIRVLGRLRDAAARCRAGLRTFLDPHVTMPRGRLYPGARMVVTMGGRITAGQGCAIADNAVVHAEMGSITIGHNAFVGIGTIIIALHDVTIGNDVLIAEYVTIRDQDHVFAGPITIEAAGFSTSSIVIGDNVWIGAKSTITRGVTIGENAVIGANSVVTRDVPPNVVAAGAPARVIRQIGDGIRRPGTQPIVLNRQPGGGGISRDRSID